MARSLDGVTAFVLDLSRECSGIEPACEGVCHCQSFVHQTNTAPFAGQSDTCGAGRAQLNPSVMPGRATVFFSQSSITIHVFSWNPNSKNAGSCDDSFRLRGRPKALYAVRLGVRGAKWYGALSGVRGSRDRRSACSVAVGGDLWTLKLSPRWAGGCGAIACVSVLQGKPKRSGWRGDATSGFLGRRSALFKHALHAVIVRRVAGAQWGERGAAMGYGLWALRLCGSRRLGALATRGRGVFVFWIVCL